MTTNHDDWKGVNMCAMIDKHKKFYMNVLTAPVIQLRTRLGSADF